MVAIYAKPVPGSSTKSKSELFRVVLATPRTIIADSPSTGLLNMTKAGYEMCGLEFLLM